MKNPAKFWDKIADKYSRQAIADEASYHKKLEITQSYLKSDMEVIELGCGTGSTAITHSPFVKHIRAIDISSKMIAIAREKARSSATENIAFEVATIEELKVPKESVDVVLALSILHLVENKDTVIEKIHAMLKPGGIFVSSTICLNDDMKWLKFIMPFARAIGLMPAVKFFDERDLVASIESKGFDIEYSWKPGKRKAVFVVARKC